MIALPLCSTNEIAKGRIGDVKKAREVGFMAKQQSLIQAQAFVKKGNYTQAIRCFAEHDPKGLCKTTQEEVRHCHQQLLRRYFRQGRQKEFSAIAALYLHEPAIRLAQARLGGPQQLSKFALAEPAKEYASLAAASMQPEPRKALITLRQSPEHKARAEGWVCLIKGDHHKAADLFSSIEAQYPLQGRLGKGIAALLQGERSMAQSLLAPLRSVARSSLPVLSRIMGWQNQEVETLESIRSRFKDRPLNEVEKELARLPTQNSLAKAMEWLCLADLFCESKQFDKAFAIWQKAAKTDDQLKGEVLRRSYLIAEKGEGPQDHFQAWFNLLSYLAKHEPAHCEDFIIYLSLDNKGDSNFDSSAIKSIESYLLSDKVPAGKLFYFIQEFGNRFKFLTHMIYIDALYYKEVILPLKDKFMQIIKQIGSRYDDYPVYVDAKAKVLSLFGEKEQARKTFLQQIQLEPYSLERSLPLYLTLALQAKNDGGQIEVYQEVEKLQRLAPSHFDLWRLKLCCCPDGHRQQLMNEASLKLSKPLFAVLKLQNSIDLGLHSKIGQLLPDKQMLNFDTEADIRLMAALCNRDLSIQESQLHNIFNHAFKEKEKISQLIDHIELYRSGCLPFSLLIKVEEEPSLWGQLLYHRALLFFEKGDFERAIQEMFNASRSLPASSYKHHAAYKTWLISTMMREKVEEEEQDDDE